jgi:nitric oxide reductase large subunit
MSAITGTIIAGSTLLKLVVGALVAGLGVTFAFSLLIYCADRAITARRGDQRAAAVLFQAAAVVALAAVLGLTVYGLILAISKPK